MCPRRLLAVRKLLTFGVTTLLLGLSSLVVVPLVVAKAGLVGWGAIAVGQSIGTMAAVLIHCGWGLTGPASVSSAPNAESKGLIYARSVAPRIYLAIPTLAVVMVIAVNAVPSHPRVAVASAFAASLSAASAAWFFVGTGDATLLLALDTVPRIGGTVVGALLLVSGSPLVALPLAQLCGALLAAVGAHEFLRRKYSLGWNFWSPEQAVRTLWSQRAAGLTSVATGAYTALPVTLVAIVSPGSTGVYAAGDRVVRMALVALSPLIQVLRGWVAQPVREETRRRAQRLLPVGWTLAVVAFIVMFIAEPPLVQRLTLGKASLTLVDAIGFALTLGAIVGSQCIGLVCLIALGGVGAAAGSALGAATIGTPLILVMAHEYGVAGAAVAVGISEVFVLVWQHRALRDRLRDQ